MPSNSVDKKIHLALCCVMGILQGSGVGADDSQTVPIQAMDSQAVHLASGMAEIPFHGTASDVLVADIDANGMLDLAFISHADNFAQVFYQRKPREFEPGSRVESVGYHPGNLFQVDSDKGPVLLMSAEGEGKLLTMGPGDDGGLKVTATANVPYPRYAQGFQWPNWGLGVAIAPFSPPSVILLQNYDPFAVKAKKLVKHEIKGTAYPLESITVSDLDGDGAEEIILPIHQWGILQVIRYPGSEGKTEIENLWLTPRLGPVKFITAADINGDGKVDLLAPPESPSATDNGASKLKILINKGELKFDLYELDFPVREKNGMPGIRAVDSAVDHDGLRYIIAAGYENYVIYQIPGNHDLSSVARREISYPRKEGNSKVVMRDIDGDGWLDFVVARGRDKNSGLVAYGPLWDYFGKQTKAQENE